MSEAEVSKVPTCGASLGTTINTGNYENYKIDVWLTGIPVNATPEYVADRVKDSKKVLEEIIFGLADELSQRIMDVKGKPLG